MHHEWNARKYAPSRYLCGAGVIVIVLAIFTLAVGSLRRGRGLFCTDLRKVILRSELRACGRSCIGDHSCSRRGRRNRGDLMGRRAITGPMNQPTGKKAAGNTTCLGTSSSLALVRFGEERPPKIGGVRGGVLLSLDRSELRT